MPRTAKIVAISVALPLLLAFLAWSATFLYWQLRIRQELREWWAAHGHRYHQGWRFWSSDCRAR